MISGILYTDPTLRFNTMAPSNEVIQACYNTLYEKYKLAFSSELNSVNFIHLSCDHAVKAEANIGFFQDEKWMKNNFIHNSCSFSCP